MPKRIRYTHLLGLNARGLNRHQKHQIVWKKYVKGKFDRERVGKVLPQKRSNRENVYWSKFHDIKQKFEDMGLKGFMQNPSKLMALKPRTRRTALRNLQSAQLNIEALKFKYGVAVPDKAALKLLSVLGRVHGVVQMKANNHCNGYWSYLLSQRNVSCRVFNVHPAANGKGNGTKKKKKKPRGPKDPKSKALLAEEARHWIEVRNAECVSTPSQILKDFPKAVLLVIYPDFKMDHDVVGEFVEKRNRRLLDGQDTAADIVDDDDLNFGGNANDKVPYRSIGEVMECGSSKETLPSVECLRAFKGNYAVHIGELFGCSWNAQRVWGQTTSSQFQIELQSNFHRIHQQPLPRWPLFRDTLTVWKRNKVDLIGQQKVLCLQDQETNDSFDTVFWKNTSKRRVQKRVDKEKGHLFEGANYKKDDRAVWKPSF